MGQIRLSDEDRARLGLDKEWIEAFDIERFTMADAELLEAHGYDTDEFLEDLGGHPVVRDGQAVMVPVLDAAGAPVLVNGRPEMRPKVNRPTRARRALVWLAVRNAGSPVPLAEFNFQVLGVQYDASKDPPTGKGPATAATSSRSAKSTRSRSARNSASSRGKSSS